MSESVRFHHLRDVTLTTKKTCLASSVSAFLQG